MPCGPIPDNPAEALSLPVMNELLDVLRERYDYIVLDTPPLLVVTDPSITASMADAVVLTLRVRRKSKPNAKEAMNILSAVGPMYWALSSITAMKQRHRTATLGMDTTVTANTPHATIRADRVRFKTVARV